MNDSDKEIEQEIQVKGLTSPRISVADIESAIASEHFFTAWNGISGAAEAGELHQREFEYDTLKQTPPARTTYEATRLLTFCVLVLKTGFTVTGESTCVSAENFDAELGRKIARQNALDKCWPLFGFHLASTLYESRQ